MNIALPNFIGIIISILLMASTIVASAALVLRVRPLPYAQALLIATVSNVLGKFFVSVLHWPGAVSYSLPTVSYFILSIVFFKPTVPKLIVYWLVGFALYLAIHVVITLLFGWSFMFPFWVPTLPG